MNAEYLAATLAVLTPLIGVPLTVILFYLKGLREQGRDRHGALVRRMDLLEAALGHARLQLTALQRDQTTKEEWLRETMWTRNRIEQLSAWVNRAEAQGAGAGVLPALARAEEATSKITCGASAAENS